MGILLIRCSPNVKYNLKKALYFILCYLKSERNAQPINNNHSFSLYNCAVKAVRIAIQKKLSKLCVGYLYMETKTTVNHPVKSKLQNPTYAWGLMALLAIIWGSSFILVKKSLTVFDASQVGSLRIASAFCFFLPL